MANLAKTVLIKSMICSEGDKYESGKADMATLLKLLADADAGIEPDYDNDEDAMNLSEYMEDCCYGSDWSSWSYLADEGAGKSGYKVGIEMLTKGEMVSIFEEQGFCVLAPLVMKDGESGKQAMARINREAETALTVLIGDGSGDEDYDEDDWDEDDEDC